MFAIHLTAGTYGTALNQLKYPYGIALDPIKNGIYVADNDNHRVMYFPVGVRNDTIVAGNNTAGVTPTQLNKPRGVYFDSISNSIIIINEFASNIVRQPIGASNWTLVAGSLDGVASSASNRFSYPADVLLDPMNNLYVTDSWNYRVQFFLNGKINGTTIAGFTGVNGSNASLLSVPNGLALDSQLNLYVCDFYNHRIQKFLRY